MDEDSLTELECVICDYCERSGLFLGPTFDPIDAICYIECVLSAPSAAAMILGIPEKYMAHLRLGFRDWIKANPQNEYVSFYQMGRRIRERLYVDLFTGWEGEAFVRNRKRKRTRAATRT